VRTKGLTFLRSNVVGLPAQLRDPRHKLLRSDSLAARFPVALEHWDGRRVRPRPQEERTGGASHFFRGLRS